MILKSVSGSMSALDEVVSIGCSDADYVGVAISATAGSTVTFEMTVDGTNWVGGTCLNLANSAYQVPYSSGGALSGFTSNAVAIAGFRVRISTFVGGPVTATLTTARNS
jgi:hypothetical protein